MSYGKNVLGLKVLDSVSFIEKGTALTIELYNNEACIRPATSNDTLVGIALEEYTRGVDNLNGDRISVSIIEFSPAIAGSDIQAGNLLSVNDSGKFIVSDKNILGVAITNGKLGELFQFVRIFSKEGSGGSGAVKSVNGMTGDVVIEANNILANVDNSMKQGFFNNAMNDAVNFLGEELEKKENKLIAGKGINIDTGTISLALETAINTSIPSGVSNLICSITNMSDLFLVVALSFKTTVDFSNFYIPLSKAVLKKMGAGIYPVVYNDQAKGQRTIGLSRDNDSSLYVSSWNGNFTQNILINLNTVIVLNP